MSSIEGLQIWMTRRSFNKHRSAFYRDLGAALDAGAPLKSLVSEYAAQDVPGISPMMNLWIEGLQRKPDSLARATEGIVGAGDTVIIAAAEGNPSGAGKLYSMYAENLNQRGAMVRAVMTPLIIPAVTFVFLIAVLFFFKIMIYADMVKGVPLKYWPFYAAYSYNMVQFMTGFGGLTTLGAIVAGGIWVVWSLPNYIGAGRDWLDTHVIPYTMVAQVNLLSSLIAMASMIQAGISDTVALKLVNSRGSTWMSYQMEKIRARTDKGKTVMSSLRELPLPKMLAARIVVLSREEKLVDALPGLVIKGCMDESTTMVERMQVTAKLVTVISVLVLLVFVLLLMLGNIGYAEASQNMNDAMARIR